MWKRVSFRNFHTVHCHRTLWKPRNLLSVKIISSNQLFSIFFSKIVAFTEFLLKKGEGGEIYSHPENISSNQLFSNFFSWNVAFTEIFESFTLQCESIQELWIGIWGWMSSKTSKCLRSCKPKIFFQLITESKEVFQQSFPVVFLLHDTRTKKVQQPKLTRLTSRKLQFQ